MKIELIGSPKIIMQNPDSKHTYFAWPTIARLKNGKIAAAASGFRIGHIGPFGKAVINYSEDEGETFTPPAPVIDTVLDDRDAGLCPFGKSGLIFTSFNLCRDRIRKSPDSYYTEEEYKYKYAYLDTVTDEEDQKYVGSTFKVSYDNGVTFGPVHIAKVTSPHGPIELRDGTILWVGATQWSEKLRIEAHTVDVENGTTTCIGVIDDIPNPDGKPFPTYEPYACQLSDGTIICHIRVHVPGATIYQSESNDGGKTWTKPHRIIEENEPDGSTSHIIEHSSGTLIAVYGHRAKASPPQGVRTMFSRDGGKTWDKHHVIFNTPLDSSFGDARTDLGYPATVELKDGSLLTVFYGRINMKTAVVMTQKWRMIED